MSSNIWFKVVNITEFLIHILKVVRLIVTITTIMIIFISSKF